MSNDISVGYEGTRYLQEGLRKRAHLPSGLPRNYQLGPAELASIQEEIATEVAYLQRDEYFAKFLSVIHESIPSIEGLSGEEALLKMELWVNSLAKPMCSYVKNQTAQSLGVKVSELAKILKTNSFLPEFKNFDLCFEANAALNALIVIRHKIFKLSEEEKKMEDELCAVFASQSIACSLEDDESCNQPSRKIPRVDPQSCSASVQECETSEVSKKVPHNQFVENPFCPQEPLRKRIKT